MYRITTRHGRLHYSLATGKDLTAIESCEWNYVEKELPPLIPQNLGGPKTKARRKWILAHFSQLAVELGHYATDDMQDEDLILHDPDLGEEGEDLDLASEVGHQNDHDDEGSEGSAGEGGAFSDLSDDDGADDFIHPIEPLSLDSNNSGSGSAGHIGGISATLASHQPMMIQQRKAAQERYMHNQQQQRQEREQQTPHGDGAQMMEKEKKEKSTSSKFTSSLNNILHKDKDRDKDKEREREDKRDHKGLFHHHKKDRDPTKDGSNPQLPPVSSILPHSMPKSPPNSAGNSSITASSAKSASAAQMVLPPPMAVPAAAVQSLESSSASSAPSSSSLAVLHHSKYVKIEEDGASPPFFLSLKYAHALTEIAIHLTGRDASGDGVDIRPAAL